MTAQSPDRPEDEVRLEELAANATAGPWFVCEYANPDGTTNVETGRQDESEQAFPAQLMEWPDARFIAACHPQAILTLLSRLTALRAERDDALAALRKIAWEPLGAAEASYKDAFHAVAEIARCALEPKP